MYLCWANFDPCMIHMPCLHLSNGSLSVSSTYTRFILLYFLYIFYHFFNYAVNTLAHVANTVSQISNTMTNVTDFVHFNGDIRL